MPYRIKKIVYPFFLTLIAILLTSQTRAQIMCGCPAVGSELVTNGDFSSSLCLTNNSDIPSVGSCNTGCNQNQRTEGSNAGALTPAMNWTATNHSPASGGTYFLMVNGSLNGNPRIWYQQSVPVTAGKVYLFSAWVINLCNANGNCPLQPDFILQVVSGSNTWQVASVTNLAFNNGTWTQICGSWEAPAGVSSVELDLIMPGKSNMVNGTPMGWGNDGGADDISFKQLNDDAGFTASSTSCAGPYTFTPDDQSDNITHSWDFGDGSATSPDKIPTHTYNGSGSYTVTHTITIRGCGTITSTKTISVTGWCTCKLCGASPFTNGDFSDPNCNFANISYGTDFLPVPGGSYCNRQTGAGQITETADASLCNPDWTAKDHTGNGSKFIAVDAAPNDQRAWFKQGVAVKKGHTYCFIAWVKNINHQAPNCEAPSFGLQVVSNGSTSTLDQVGPLIYNDCPTGWTKMCGSWTAPSDGNVELDVILKGGGWHGFDGGVDDIAWSDQAPPDPSFTVTLPTDCSLPVEFHANDQGGTQTWIFDDGTPNGSTPDIQHKFQAGGITYNVKHIITTPCGTLAIVQQVQIPDCCCTLCDPNANLVTDGNFSAMPCYSWVNPPAEGTDITVQQPCGYIGPTGPDQYIVGPIANGMNIVNGVSTWDGMEHTGDGIGMLMVDGQTNSPNGEKRAWFQDNVPVTPNTPYCFIAWIMNPDNVLLDPGATIKLEVFSHALNKAITVATISNWPHSKGWAKLCGTYFSAVPEMVELRVVIVDGQHSGYDIAIDDISFAPDCGHTNQQGGGGDGGGNPTGVMAPVQLKNNPANNYTITNNPFTQPQTAEPKEDAISLSPVPVRRGESLHMSYTATIDKNIQIRIMDMNGRVYNDIPQTLLKGQNDIQLKTEMLAPGTYYIKTVSNGVMKTETIVIVE